jgi:hypothetical protein
MAINFPNNPDNGQTHSVQVDGSDIVYKYDQYKGWLLLPSAESSFVNKDYVDVQDNLKYDRLGGRISGSVSISTFNETRSNVEISDSGTLSFYKYADSKISFQDGGRNSILVGDDTILKIQKEQVITYTTIRSDNTNKPILSYIINGPQSEVLILNSFPTNAPIKNILKLNNSSTSSFVVRGTSDSDLFTVTASGQTLINSNNVSLNVSRLNGSNKETFTVNTNDYKIKSSEAYNLGLISGNRNVVSPSGNTFTATYTEDELLATLGVVKKYQYTPGQAVFAESESETEINGLWTDGTNYYIRYK